MAERKLEVCVDSVESAVTADANGADRLELCSNLVIGGTTPGLSLFRRVRELVGAKIHVLLRPRFGDFLYTDEEYGLVLQEAQTFLKAGADGLVCGFLREDGSLWEQRMAELAAMIQGYQKSFTLHRAFDVCNDPEKALSVCEKLGVNLILTSGQQSSCVKGLPLLSALSRQCREVTLLYAGGIDARAIEKIRREIPEAGQFHMSGKRTVESAMKFRREGVPMGLPALSEFELWRCDGGKIKEAKESLVK